MSHANPSDRAPALATHNAPRIEHVAPGWLLRDDALRLYLHADPDAPGWTAETPEAAARPITVRQAVKLAGPHGAVLVIEATRAILDRLPAPAAAQLRAELDNAQRLVIGEAGDALAAIRDGIDAVALIVGDAPDLLGELTASAARLAEHVEAQRRQLDGGEAPVGLLLALAGSAGR